MTTKMIIDTHVYCLPPQLRMIDADIPKTEFPIIEAIYSHPDGEYALNLASPESIVESMGNSGVNKSVLVSFPWNSEKLCTENNNYLLEQISSGPFYCICAVQPRFKAFVKEAERCIDRGAIGLKVNPAWQGYALDGPEMDALSVLCSEKKIPIMVHVDQSFKKSPTSAAHLLKLAKKHPNTRYLAAHLGGLLGIYNLHDPMKESLKNIWFDTAVSSTLKMVKFYVESGLENKILFGSDFPFNHSHSQKQLIDEIAKFEIGETDKTKIFSDNFKSLFNID